MEFMKNFDEAEKFDKLKSKVLKYVLYKKRTEQEVLKKFSDEDQNLLDDVIENLKELKYIDDFSYIERTVMESLNLKNLSIKELTYKLYQKGISRNIVDDYVLKNEDILLDYEIKSALNLWNKKIKNSDIMSIKDYLYRKGYMQETVNIIEKENT